MPNLQFFMVLGIFMVAIVGLIYFLCKEIERHMK